MWNNIVNEGVDLCWVVDALKNGTAIWVTDGSFNRPIAPLVSGAGWIIEGTVGDPDCSAIFERVDYPA